MHLPLEQQLFWCPLKHLTIPIFFRFSDVFLDIKSFASSQRRRFSTQTLGDCETRKRPAAANGKHLHLKIIHSALLIETNPQEQTSLSHQDQNIWICLKHLQRSWMKRQDGIHCCEEDVCENFELYSKLKFLKILKLYSK